MPIVTIGQLFDSNFNGKTEKKFEMLLGGLPVGFSILRPDRNLTPDAKYKISLLLTKEQHDEVRTALLERLSELNKEGGYGATEKQLAQSLEQQLGESTAHPGQYRLLGSRKMAFQDKETKELVAARMVVHLASKSDDTIIPNPVLGNGSIARTRFIVSMFRLAGGKGIGININPIDVIVTHYVPYESKRTQLSHDGLDDVQGSAYDY